MFAGDIRKTIEEMSVEWRVTDVLSLSDEVGVSYNSPFFLFLGESWYLKMFPNGEIGSKAKDWISVYVCRKCDSSPVNVACTIGLKTADGKKHKDCNFTHVFQKLLNCGCTNFVKRSELVENKNSQMPASEITITCSVKKHVPSFVSRTEELSRDFSVLLFAETDSDVTVRVEAKEFRLHRSVLGARSPVFAAMFRHKTEEKVAGVVHIDDCRADVFRSFAHYLYTGKVEEISAANVLDLFRVADKYQVEELAEDCVGYMKDTLTVDTFCDAIEVALNRGLQFLLDAAIVMLSDEMEEIVKTDRWQSFMLKDPVRANEQLRRAFDRKRNQMRDLSIIRSVEFK